MSDKQDSKQQTPDILGAGILSSSTIDEDTIVEMAKAGILYGHKKSRRNPKFNDYIFAVRNGVEVIDLSKTIKTIDILAAFLKKNLDEKKTFMIIGTQPAAKEAVLKLSAALGNCSYIVNKWVGGLITNFANLYKRIEYYKKKRKDMEEHKFDGYTKKEQLLISREIEKMRIRFTGLEQFGKIPDVMFIIDSSLKNHMTALREAKIKKVSVVGMIDNDDDPGLFDYFVPANDHARSSINWVVDKLISKIK